MTKEREAPIEAAPLNPDEFWRFCLRTYDIPQVKATCLALQDNYSADVNMLLLCCWLDKQRISLSKNMWDDLYKLSADWQENTLNPLRAKRRKATRPSAAYTALLDMELSREKSEQKALLDFINKAPSALGHMPSAKPKNLLHYGAILKLPQASLISLTEAIMDS